MNIDHLNSLEKREQIIELIVMERKDWFSWLQKHKEKPNIRDAVQKAKKLRAEKEAQLKQETEVFRQNIKDCFRGQYNDLDGEFWNPWDKNGPHFDDVNHIVRKVQEPYLLALLDLPEKGSSLENWASIGMAIANEKTNTLDIVNNTENREKRGRKRGAAIDYRRAEWLYFLHEYIFNYFSDQEKRYVNFKLKEILEAYTYACKNPATNNYPEYFEYLENKLKICGKSLNSLYVSFNRGEKERESMWDD